MSSDPIRVAAIGLGKMGVMHCAVCSILPELEVVALVDLDEKLGLQIRSMGVDAPFFRSLDDLFASDVEVDAAVISTPQSSHRFLGLKCLEAGLHVLCEKPLAHHPEDAIAMARAAAERPGQVAATAFMKGHYPLWLEAARRLHAGEIGAPQRFAASVFLSQVFKKMKSWAFSKEKSGGGVVISSGVHLLHVLTVLFGPGRRVLSATATPIHSEVDDAGQAELEMGDGVRGTFECNWSKPGYPTEGTTIEIEGDAGRMVITDERLVVEPTGGESFRAHRSEFETASFNNSPDYGGEGWYRQMVDFAGAIREGRPPRYDWGCGCHVNLLADAIYRSAEEKAATTVATV